MMNDYYYLASLYSLEPVGVLAPARTLLLVMTGRSAANEVMLN